MAERVVFSGGEKLTPSEMYTEGRIETDRRLRSAYVSIAEDSAICHMESPFICEEETHGHTLTHVHRFR